MHFYTGASLYIMASLHIRASLVVPCLETLVVTPTFHEASLGPTGTDDCDRRLGRRLGQTTGTDDWDRSLGPTTGTDDRDRSLGPTTGTDDWD